MLRDRRGWVVVAPVLALVLSGCGQSSSTLEVGGMAWEPLSGRWLVEEGALVGSGGNIQSIEVFGDATFEVDVEMEPALGDRTVGVAFRYSVSEGGLEHASGFGFNFNGLSQYNTFRGDNNVWRPVNPAFTVFQPSTAFKARNHVAIIMKGSVFTVKVNGEEVQRFEDASAWEKGRVGFWVESSAHKVRFSGLKITPNG